MTDVVSNMYLNQVHIIGSRTISRPSAELCDKLGQNVCRPGDLWWDHPSHLLPSNFVFIYCFIPLLKPSFLLLSQTASSNHSLQSAVTWTEHQTVKREGGGVFTQFLKPPASFILNQTIMKHHKGSKTSSKSREPCSSWTSRTLSRSSSPAEYLWCSQHLNAPLHTLQEPWTGTPLHPVLLGSEGFLLQRAEYDSQVSHTNDSHDGEVTPLWSHRDLSFPHQPLELRGETSSEEHEEVQLSSTRWTILLCVTTCEN